MDTSDVCQQVPHPACSACGEQVFRRQWHAHSYGSGRQRARQGTLCGACYDLVLVASEAVLQALQSTGRSMSAFDLHRAIHQGRVAVLVMDPLPLN